MTPGDIVRHTMKVGDRVQTEYGPGKIVDIENPDGRTTRYAVLLDKHPGWEKLGFNRALAPSYFFKSELKKLDTDVVFRQKDGKTSEPPY